MLRAVGSVGCPPAEASADPWIPLTVAWQPVLHDAPLHLYLRGAAGGYVDLKVDPTTGALSGLVIVDLPPTVDRIVPEAPVRPGSLVPLLDLDLWEWKVTPDYREPARRDIDAPAELSYSRAGDAFTLWLAHAAIDHYLAGGEVRIAMAADDTIVAVTVSHLRSSA